MKYLQFFAVFAVIAAVSMASPVYDNEDHHRVRRGYGGSGVSVGGTSTVVDGIAVGAVSGGNNQFVWQQQAAQNFLASSGQANYLQQQGALQAAAAASAASAWAGQSYNQVATGPNLPTNVAGYGGFPSYG